MNVVLLLLAALLVGLFGRRLIDSAIDRIRKSKYPPETQSSDPIALPENKDDNNSRSS